MPNGIVTVDSMCLLGITFQNNLSMDDHVNNIMTDSNQKLYAINKLKANGASPQVLQEVYRAKVLSCILYASPAWWGYTSAENKLRIFFLKNQKNVGSMRSMDSALNNFAS